MHHRNRNAALFSLTTMALLVLASACSSASGAGTPDGTNGTNEPATATIGAAGGSVTGDGVRLDVPAGALASDVTISAVASSDPAPDGYEALSSIFVFSPDGLTFSKPATVTIAFEGDATEAAIAWSNATGFDDLPSMNNAGMMTAQVTHFSRGFVGKHKGSPPEDASPSDDGGANDSTAGDGDSAAKEGGPTDGGPSDTSTDTSDGNTCHASTTSCDAGSQCCSGVCSTGGICT
jgi:hypothetical protein